MKDMRRDNKPRRFAVTAYERFMQHDREAPQPAPFNARIGAIIRCFSGVCRGLWQSVDASCIDNPILAPVRIDPRRPHAAEPPTT